MQVFLKSIRLYLWQSSDLHSFHCLFSYPIGNSFALLARTINVTEPLPDLGKHMSLLAFTKSLLSDQSP